MRRACVERSWTTWAAGSRARRRIAPVAIGLVLMVTSACSKSEGGVTISGDVAGIDTIATRGDSLIARAGQLPQRIDTLRAVAEGKITRPASSVRSNPTSDVSMAGANAMTARAQAKGDSIARANAPRYMGPSSDPSRARRDSVRGVVTLVGTAPARQVMLRVTSGAIFSMSGMATTGLAQLEGTEIVVRGMMISPRDVVVSDYLVRASNGIPALDGRLEGGDGGWWLELTDGSGRKRISAVPMLLQQMVGTRVWIAVRPGSASASAYGIIRAR